ncbi:MAG TPA: glycosyltransferase family 4 protein [Actinomycetes bacterium]|jgi:glycosyltransferase involved in cell wall biosynthesis|nr:glycosyltransferase family 4 protein [Actinomycetes bacterium]
MTRVLYLTQAFPRYPGDLPGRFLWLQAVALADEGVEVEVLAPSAPGLPARDWVEGAAVRRYRYAPGRLETIAYTGAMATRAAKPGGMLALAGLVAAGSLAARRVGRGSDLVHAHWWFPSGLQAYAAQCRPLVTTFHGTDLRLTRHRPAARALCARVMRASAAVTTASTWLAEVARSLAPDCADRIRVLPTPADDRLFVPGDAPRGELLFVGRLDGQKGAEVAIRALAGLTGPSAELPLRIVGGGEQAAALRRLAAELGVADRIVWEHGLSGAELGDRYRRAVALLVPGLDEGLGLVAIEAQLCATPVVAVDSGGLRDVVSDRVTGRLFPPGDHRALARAVEDLRGDPPGAAAMGDRARRSAVERFGIRRGARAFAALYAEVLAGRQGARRRAART